VAVIIIASDVNQIAVSYLCSKLWSALSNL